MTNELCNAYYAIQRQELGYTPRMTDALVKSLPKAVDICIELNADPITYVKAQRKFCVVRNFPPNQLHTNRAREKYIDYVESYRDNDLDSYIVQKRYLYDAIKSGRSAKSVLLDDVLDFRPWFRVVITKEPIPEVIERYNDQAKEELTPKLEALLKKEGLDVNRIKGS